MAVQLIKDEILSVGLHYREYAGKTADTKPVAADTCTGSKFFNIQTGVTSYYDAAASSGSEWITPS